MTTDPRKIIETIRCIETDLSGIESPLSRSIQNAERNIQSTLSDIDHCRTSLQSRLELAIENLQKCYAEAARQNQNDPDRRVRVDCSRYECEVQQLQRKLTQVIRARKELEHSASVFRATVAQFKDKLNKDLHKTTHWLRERENGLQQFENTSAGPNLGQVQTPIASAKTIGKSQRESAQISKTQAAVATTILAALPVIFQQVSGGGHGSRYRRARQQFLRSLEHDERQPRFVRGWIKQELNRLQQVKQARSSGKQPPGGNKRHLRGVPGYDVGHRYPDIDLPENFRLEDANMNRRRPGLARRLGLSDWIR